MAYLSKNDKLQPFREYYADMEVNITDFNLKQGRFQKEIANQLTPKGHKFYWHKIVPIARDEKGGYFEVKWHETGIIKGVRVYFHINIAPLVILAIIGAIALAAAACALFIHVVGIAIVNPITKTLTNPVFIIGAIAFVFVLIALPLMLKKSHS